MTDCNTTAAYAHFVFAVWELDSGERAARVELDRPRHSVGKQPGSQATYLPVRASARQRVRRPMSYALQFMLLNQRTLDRGCKIHAVTQSIVL